MAAATKKSTDELEEAIAEEAKPDAELEVRGTPRKNDRPQSAAMAPNSTMGSRAGRTKPANPSGASDNTTFAERAAARDKRVKADTVTSK